MSGTIRRIFRWPWRTRDQIRTDLEEEFALHAELRCEELVARGVPPGEARAIAAREFADMGDARRYIHAVDETIDVTQRRRDLLDNASRSVRHAMRRLWRAPVFTITSVLTLTIGIGACALMMSLVSTILLKPLPYDHPDRVEMIWGYYPEANLGFAEQPTHGRLFSIMRDNSQAFDVLAGFRGASFNLGSATNPERLDGVQVTGGFFHAIGVSPELGYFFDRTNETPGNDHVAVLSDALWRSRFGGDPNIIGRAITLNSDVYTVVGVAARGFAFPRGAEMPGDFQFAATPEIWTPLDPPKDGPDDLAIIGRLRPGVTDLAARQDMDRMIEIIERAIPGTRNFRPREILVPLHQQVVGDAGIMLISLLAGVVLVLAIACVNTAQLLLAQLHARRRELAIRAALGGSARRLAGEVLAEVLLLVLCGGAAGIAAGVAGLGLVRAYGAERLPRVSELTFDARSTIAALCVIVVAAIMASIIPMIIGSRVQLVETLRSGGRGAGLRGISVKARRTLIVCELAGSLVLVTSAGLLIRSLSHQLNAKLGFDTVHGLTFEVSLPPIRYPEQQLRASMDHAAAVPFLTSALENIRALPGVTAAGIGKPLPLSGAQEATVFTPETSLPPLPAGTSSPMAQFTVASPDMVRALGTPIVAGRDFSSEDRTAGAPVVLVNESMAEWLWPGGVAVGKRIRVGPPAMRAPLPPWMTVVGVVANMKRYALTESPRPEMIVPYTQNPYPTFSTMQFVVRSRLDAAALVPEIQRAIAAADPTIPIAHVRTIDDLVMTSASNARFVTLFMGAFGIVALVLAIIGVYGVIAYSVQQRRQEFGVRRALGAGPREILNLILRECLNLTAVGLALGFALTLAAGAGLRHLLFDLSPFDPATLAGAVIIIATATAAACLIPAIAAARVEPRAALEE
jgi:putative ABC transport system permease protein